MTTADSPPPPRWWVNVTAGVSFLLGVSVIVNEAFIEPAASPERPMLLALAYALVSGSVVAAFLERFRRP